MSFGISAADIVKLGKIAWQLWELGFSQAKNAGLYAPALLFGSSLPIKHGIASFPCKVQAESLLTLNGLVQQNNTLNSALIFNTLQETFRNWGK